ncbi:TonB-dependent receptor domain-containing protein [Piscinibacter sp.]|uniref:TonB-dependent receptor domain-containing protein n=1 Tax=Piscinibacter sp. TaxID=1903157 RepID=UPI0039E3DABF
MTESSSRRAARSTIARAIAGALPFIACPPALAQAVAALDSVVISGTREPLALERLAADVVVIDADTIRQSSADSVADLLRRQAGVQLSRSGGPGQSAGVFIRGASSGQSAVFVDGVRVGSATLGSPSLESLSLAQIERIEVLRGPGSSLYGADALGGVINIYTRRGDGPARIDAHAAIGGYGSNQASLAVSGGVGDWDLAGSLSHEKSDGVSAVRPGDLFGNHNPDDDGYRLDSAQAQIGFKPAAGHRIGLVATTSRLNAQYDSSEYPPPTFAPDNTPDFRNKLNTRTVALDYRGALTPELVGSARIDSQRDDSKTGGNGIAHYRTTRQGASAQLAWKAGAIGQLVGALEHVEEKALSSDIGPGSLKRRNSALVLELTGDAGPWSWQLDARHDDNSAYGNVNTGRIGGAFAFAPGWKLRALAGTTFRAPTFNDLYYPGYGVETLEPERGRGIELGVAWQGDGSEAAATVYRNRVRNLIGYQGDATQCPDPAAYPFGCAGNTARAKLDGATLSGAQRLGALALRAQIDFVDAKDTDSGERLARRAKHQETLSADWDGGSWSVGAAVLNLASRPDGGKRLGGETTLDLKAAWRFLPQWSLEAKLLNATDERIEPARDYQGLGRQAWIGVRYSGGW